MIKKLHLGCGQKYLEGYINIDYPLSFHTVQKQIKADRFTDILKLKYSPNTIDEIRLHHVFEHFPRAISCALLAVWNIWLKDNGLLRIEVPDFEKMAKTIISPLFSERKKMVAERHIFGSQEKNWATHFAGYSEKRLTDFLKKYGFRIDKIKRNNWRGTSNIEVFAVKTGKKRSLREYEKITKDYLDKFLLDASVSEKRLLEIWIKPYRSQIKKSFNE